MIGAIIGILCGALELYLLVRVVKAVSNPQKAGSAGLLVLAKLLVLTIGFAVVIVFFRSDILYCGIGVSAVLVIGSVIFFSRNNAKLKREEEQKRIQDNDKGGNGEHA